MKVNITQPRRSTLRAPESSLTKVGS
uniref:Uncharacterized protein MANES_02G200100 n=1 Tax=Rhizophora mucronata TaxID=61149 RepID=A0A2P2JQM2_RHIMU